MITKIWQSIINNPYRYSKFFLFSFFLSLLINIATWIFLYLKISPFKIINQYGEVSLHYNIYLGIDKIGSWYLVLILPLVGLLILIINIVLSFKLYIKQQVLSFFLTGIALVVQIIILAAGIFIFLLNVS